MSKLTEDQKRIKSRQQVAEEASISRSKGRRVEGSVVNHSDIYPNTDSFKYDNSKNRESLVEGRVKLSSPEKLDDTFQMSNPLIDKKVLKEAKHIGEKLSKDGRSSPTGVADNLSQGSITPPSSAHSSPKGNKTGRAF